MSVLGQSTQPGCPATGSFEDWFGNDTTSAFSQVCRDRLLTLRYNSTAATPMALRFSDQPGVTVEIKNYGRTDSAPFYEPLYDALEDRGYVRDKDIRVAGYDSRRTPDQGGFLARTVALIEQTYRENGNVPVHLVGHSNGPLYAQYLLTHTTSTWRSQYVHGFSPLAGNWPGQGLLVSAEKGSGLPTVVGVTLPDLRVGQVLNPATAELFTRDGDANQEDITNDAIAHWSTMPCYRFTFTDNPGVDHFTLSGAPAVLARLLTDLERPRSAC